MKETKHTPGPWELGEPTSQLEFGVYATDKISGIRYFLANAEGHMRYKESLANARLIAAAPELLEALHDVLSDYMAVHGLGDLEMKPALFRACAAMYKATGCSA